jgi:spore maturation protein CgeB
LVYAFEPTDIPDLKKYNVDTKYLPLAYDPETFFPMNDGIKEYDISFVGHLNSNRKKLLDEILREREDLKMKIWGKQWSLLQPENYLDYQLHRYHVKKCLNNYNITPNEANKIYNISKICFNNHAETTKTGINPRFFEIFGSGAFQLVDYKPVLDTLFDYNCMKFCYRNRNELLENIQYYLENEKERNTVANDMNKIMENAHTYYHRIKEILRDINGTSK